MVVRKRPEYPFQPAPILRALRLAREAMRSAQDSVRPFGPFYKAAGSVIDAIDELTLILTGDPRYFSLDPHGGGCNPLGSLEDKLAREREETPWRTLDDHPRL